MYKILIIEDNFELAKSIKDYLGPRNYQVTIATQGWSGMKLAGNNSYDLLILDVMLPDLSGFHIARSLREDQVLTPIIILSACVDTKSIITGFEAGVDNYLAKPFNLLELKARIDSCLRRPPTERANEIMFENGTVKLAYNSIQLRNKNIRLRKKEALILEYLFKNSSRIVSRTELFNSIWGAGADRHHNILDVYISKLRSKMGQRELIQTVHNGGFKLQREILAQK
jgi:DNA-binding response OmpR family regulator